MLNRKIVIAVVLILYLVPTLIQFEYNEQGTINKIYIGLPHTQTGDEPHYYITLYSLVNDHDIFLTNNYNNAFYRNGSDLGKKKWSYFNRHTRLFYSENKTIVSIPFLNKTNLDLSYVPQEKSEVKEISGHAQGLPFFAFLFLWPLKNTPLLEAAAIYMTLVFSFLGLWAFYKIMMHYHNDEQKALLFTLILALATQYWHYSKTFWAEPYLASFLIISWYLVVVKKTYWSYLLSGFLLGFGFLMKYPFLLTIFPFYLYFSLVSMKNKKIEYIPFLSFSIPLAFCFASILYLNYSLTGDMLAFNQIGAVHFVNPLKGIINWLFNPTFGLFTFSPVLLFACFGIKNFLKKNKEQVVVLGLSLGMYSLFWMAYIVAQEGAGGYSARYLVPLIPFFMLLCSFSNAENSRYKVLFYILISVSLLINVLAAVAYPAFTGYAIITSFEKLVRFFFGT